MSALTGENTDRIAEPRTRHHLLNDLKGSVNWARVS
jgi:hypothetical protein